MKRIVLVSLALCLAFFAGCGAKNVNLSEVMASINSSYGLTLEPLEGVDELDRYYGISTQDVKQFAAEIDANNNAPVEIVLVEAVDDAAASDIEAALGARYNSILSQYASYTPEKLDMVKNCKVEKNGRFVSLIVADDAEGITSVYNENLN